jgi:hypothetical protein
VLEDNDVWTVFDRSTPFLTRRDVTSYEGLVRLAPGCSLDEAQAAADATAARLAEAHWTTNSGRTFRIAPLKAEVVEPVRRPLVSVAIAAAATLVVALANLAILGLVRGCERQTELSIREALGAGSFRLRRQLFTENALIAACGALCGVALAHRIVRGLVLSDAANLPRADAVRFDAPVLWMAGATAFLLAVVLTAQPLHVRSSTLRTGARTAGTSVRRSRRVMVATEIALALVLSAGGGLLALSFVRLLAVDPGFDRCPAAGVGHRRRACLRGRPAGVDRRLRGCRRLGCGAGERDRRAGGTRRPAARSIPADCGRERSDGSLGRSRWSCGIIRRRSPGALPVVRRPRRRRDVAHSARCRRCARSSPSGSGASWEEGGIGRSSQRDEGGVEGETESLIAHR